MSRSTCWTVVRAIAGPAAALAVATAASACLNFSPYQCDSNEQCDAQELGLCQSVGYCSYPDLACPETGYRYDDDAGDDLGGQCVAPDVAGTDTEPTTTDPTDTDPSLDSGDSTADPTEGPETDTDADTDTDTDTTGGECGGGGEECCEGNTCDTGLTCQEGLCGCITAVEVGDRHSCAIKADGAVECWGANDLGQLGMMDIKMSTTPVEVAGFGPADPAEAISARLQTCVLRTDGSVGCWGDNAGGKINYLNPDVPTFPLGEATWVDPSTRIGAGGTHTCAGQGVGSPIQCWGANNFGQLSGPGGPAPQSATVPGDFTPWVIALGDTHSCVSGLTGELLCWGNNASGQLAMNPAVTASTSTPTVMPVDLIGSVAVGAGHSCVRIGETVQCWGNNADGQVGDGTGATTFTPTTVIFPEGTAAVTDLVAADDHTCAVVATGEVLCWGGNESGEIALVGDKQGDDSFSLNPRETKVDFPVAQLATGTTHSCALSTSGQVYCWGANDDGQLGDGTVTDASTPTQVQIECP